MLQTFLFSLVNGNNIYFALDKQARQEKGALETARSSASLGEEAVCSTTNLLVSDQTHSLGAAEHPLGSERSTGRVHRVPALCRRSRGWLVSTAVNFSS